MANTEVLQAVYDRGVVTDLPRHAMPRGAVWRLIDWIPNLDGAPLSKRGGWDYASPTLNGSSVRAVAWAPFVAGAQLVAITSDSDLWTIASSASATNKGDAFATTFKSRPVFFNDKLIIPSDGTAASLYKYDGSAAPAQIASSPAARYLATYKSRLVAMHEENVYFSDPADETGWDTSLAFIPMTQPGTGIAAMRNSILIYSLSGVERIRGDIPPPGGDMVREPIFEQGCLDGRSVVQIGDRAIWANADGVWISDGAAIDNLIELGGLQEYWSELFEDYTTSWVVAAGQHRGNYIVSIFDGSSFVDCLMCDIDRKTWVFLDNIPTYMFAEAFGAAPELYFGYTGDDRVGALSGIWTPSSSNPSDANGVDVQPVLETSFFRGKPGSRRWKNLHITNRLETEDPDTYLKVSYILDATDTSYTDLVEEDGSTLRKILPANDEVRTQLPFRKASDGIGLRIEQVGPSDVTQLLDIEAEVRDREGSK